MQLTLKILSPEIKLGMAEAVHNVAGITIFIVTSEMTMAPRGLRSVRALHRDVVVTRETRASAAKRRLHLQSSLESECAGIDVRESEASIVALKPGNSGGAKGRRLRMVGQRNMDRTLCRMAP